MQEKNSQTTIRACSYKPEEDLILLTYEENGREELYLEVKYRVKWFHQYCLENNLSGFIDDSEVLYIPEAQMFLATASVYIDNTLVGKSSAGVPYSANNPNASKVAIQTAATCAKGRALANAGFGTINCAMEEGDRFPCDSGIKITTDNIVSNPENPMEVTFLAPVDGKANDPVSNRQPSDTKAKPEPVSPQNKTEEAPAVSMTLEEAKAYMIPIGTHKGKSLGEVLAIDPGIIKFYAGDRFQNAKLPQLKVAAQIIARTLLK